MNTPLPTPRFDQAIELAKEIAVREHSSYVGSQHLFVAILSDNQPFSKKVFDLLGISTETARKTAIDLLRQEVQAVASNTRARHAEVLKKLLDELAESGEE